jgi:hypothetical protein
VGVFDTASATPFSVLNVVPDTISLAHPANDTHGNTDDSDIEPDVIAAMPPHAEVSTLLAARPVSETGLGQSSSRCEPAELAVPPRVRVPVSKLLELKAARLSQQAHQLNQKAQAGLRPSNDEARLTTHPTREEISVLKERSQEHCKQHQLEQEHEAKELEALEHKLMECETQATREAMTSGGRDPQALIAESPPLGNSQVSACDADGPTELEIMLATPDLSPEIKKFLGQKKFQNATKMVPSDILTTARRVP